MSTAQPSDVRGVIATELSDPDIQNYLDDAEFEAEQAIDDYQNALSNTEQTQLEKYVAALRIRQWVDRAIESTSRETASVSYEGMGIEALKKAVDKRDPSGTLAFQTDTDRYTGVSEYDPDSYN